MIANIDTFKLIDIEEPKRRLRHSGPLPFAWKKCEDDPKYIEPIPEDIHNLEIAAWYVESGYSAVSVHEWLTKITGKNITRPGMLKAIKNVRSRDPVTNQIQEKGHN